MRMSVKWIAAVVSICSGLARADELLVTSFFSDRVDRFSLPTGASLGPLDLAGGLDGPLCTRIGPDGKLYVASEESNSIKRYNPADGSFIDTFVSPGSGGLAGPSGVTWGLDGHLYVSSFDNNSVLKYDGATGAFIKTFVTTASGGLSGPDNGSVFGPDGDLYVPSYWNGRIMKYDGETGDFMGAFITGISRPRVLEFRDGKLYITSEGGHSVRRYDAATGVFIDNFVAPRSGGLVAPSGMAFGNDGYLYVSSLNNDQVLRYNAETGAFVDVFLTGGGIDGPVFLTIIPAPGAALPLSAGLLLARRRRR